MIDLVVQNASIGPDIPLEKSFQLWVEAALANHASDAAVTLRLVDEPEGRELNQRFRKKDNATNVLSFPCDLSDESGLRILGDIVVCEPVVTREALEQGKHPGDHWAHVIIHGLLHLLGFDHIESQQAEEMEGLEVSLLREMDVSNPYSKSA